jgi:hypothetical protein
MEEQRKKLFQRVETDRGKVSWRGRQKNLCFSESFLRCPEAECKRDYVDTFPWVRTRVNDGSFVPRLPASAIPANTECKTRVNLNLVLACDLCKKSGKKNNDSNNKEKQKIAIRLDSSRVHVRMSLSFASEVSPSLRISIVLFEKSKL